MQEKYDYVETIIRLLEMQDIAGACIGAPGSGLNQEQRKRVTIGVELASKPQLLMFLDEPTSVIPSSIQRYHAQDVKYRTSLVSLPLN